MDISIKTYEEFANEHKKYDGSAKCFVYGCDKPAYYEGGDARFYCGMCEEHVGLKESYLLNLKNIKNKIRIRMLWDKDDPTLKCLYDEITRRIKENT